MATRLDLALVDVEPVSKGATRLNPLQDVKSNTKGPSTVPGGSRTAGASPQQRCDLLTFTFGNSV